ncbi:hypothetical protein M422DRAFT_258320 [Sphaerobolus stellatus SS14]|uniref:F-box domain-containing protein n=1 Tax=Sphaerobolus stellatus (strain SS14) TaxID=990650 RepID=A0A0C9VBM7_SPHS4|nr:hypothetical protein M422DRAFT_258320 [Sphaerobolus stellatus SS14]
MNLPWDTHFRNGIAAFRVAKYADAVDYFTKSINYGGDRYDVYDSRAAAFEKQGKLKEALKDCRKVIELAPGKRHGYLRSARVFLQAKKYDTALDMIRRAFGCVPENDAERRNELDVLEKMIMDAKDSASPVRPPKKFPFVQLPVELVCEIFAYVVAENSVFPLLASHVSRDWRAFALSKPEYWGSLVLSDRMPQRKVSAWLERSKGKITELRILRDMGTLQLQDIMEQFYNHPGIFKHIKIFHAEAHIHQISVGMVGIPDLLKNLDIGELRLSVRRSKLATHDGTTLSPFVLRDRPSNISSLTIEWIMVEWNPIVHNFTHLRTLLVRGAYQFPSLENLLALFGQNPGLEKVILDKDYITEINPQPPANPGTHDIHLPNLACLHLTGDFKVDVILQHLNLPVLQSLTLVGCHPPVHIILNHLEPKSAPIKEVNINLCRVNPERLVGFFSNLKELENFTLNRTPADVGLIVDALAGTHNLDSGEVAYNCPRLRRVNLHSCSNLEGGPIVRLVKSRLEGAQPGSNAQNGPPCKLEEIRIDYCPKIDPSVPTWLHGRVTKFSCVYMSKKEGMKIRQ